MRIRVSIIIALLAFLLYIKDITAQSLSLTYLEHHVIPEQVDGLKKVGGLSAIAYNSLLNKYITVADKPPSRLINFNLQGDQPESVNLIKPEPLSSSELEGIVFDSLNNWYYLADEQSVGTRIFKTDTTGNFLEIVLPRNRPFLDLSAHNSGIEGLALNKTGDHLYFAFERPTESCFDQRITTIGIINLDNNKVNLYAYELHKVEDDALNTNGISEILLLDDTTLLIMERAYISGTGNVVRLYETVLGPPVEYESAAIKCDDSFPLATSKLVFDFADAEQIKIDNAEGMTFNANRSQLVSLSVNKKDPKPMLRVLR
jgi:hypothetical protein